MDKRIETADGRVIRLHVDDEAVVAADDAERPPIESDPDELDEGAESEAVVLVDQQPSTLTVEGAIVAFGQTARALSGRNTWAGYEAQPRGWWHDWGKYVLGIVAFLALSVMMSFGVVRF